jgi:periplasmic divalent cation tolerance protein
MTDKIVVFSTCGSAEEAGTLARQLIETRVAACVNVFPQIRSYYRWEGKIQSAEECVLMIKTSRDLFEKLRTTLEAAHSYELPEVIALAVIDGSPNYLEWLTKELKID